MTIHNRIRLKQEFLLPKKTTTHLIKTKYIVIHQLLINLYIIFDPNASPCHSINCLELNFIDSNNSAIFSATIQPRKHETVKINWDRYACSGFRLFNGIEHYTTHRPNAAFHGDVPIRNQVIEACPWYFVQFSKAWAVAGRWRRLSEQLDDGCHGDWSFAIVSVYIAGYRNIFRSAAEPSDVQRWTSQSSTGHSGLITNVSLSLGDMLGYAVICCDMLRWPIFNLKYFL